ncbi:hypothetical protein K470DRAFT_254606 [Piedraia hortae CBS 480.64]|uniref:MIF4G domain-containing protein n=1 Tax=Piedraia hortae CBS 480.64 TaxID=1314780 RepID=A0A6A7C874_9PEZI|nr:hypothetical protein K470DRAFT_254606 [Piedraia hortae CBS 480.64]
MNSVAQPVASDTTAHVAHVAASTTAALPVQQPARSQASPIKTASHTLSDAASASAQNVKPSEAPVNGGATSVGGARPHNVDQARQPHSRKTSLVISANGMTGHAPNGPSIAPGARSNIHFGAMTEEATRYQPTASGLRPLSNPRLTSPSQSPSALPMQPMASGGRPPAMPNQSAGPMFGQLVNGVPVRGPDDHSPEVSMRPPSMPMDHGLGPVHERRTSSHSEMNMRPGLPTQQGRRFPSQTHNQVTTQGSNFRPLGTPGSRPNIPQQMNGPYVRPSGSPASFQRPQQHMGQGYNYQHMPPNMMPPYDAFAGAYYPYYPQGGPPMSPRPNYPHAYAGGPGPMQQPYHPPDMLRSGSQGSHRPPSRVEQQQLPTLPPQQSPHVPSSDHAPLAPQFVKAKKNNAIVIKDPEGNPLDFSKAGSSTTSGSKKPLNGNKTPVTASTPGTQGNSASGNQHQRTGSRSAAETKNAFQEEVKRRMQEQAQLNAKTDTSVESKPIANVDTAVKTTDVAVSTPANTTSEAGEEPAKLSTDKLADKKPADEKSSEEKPVDAKPAVGADETKAKSEGATGESKLAPETKEASSEADQKVVLKDIDESKGKVKADDELKSEKASEVPSVPEAKKDSPVASPDTKPEPSKAKGHEETDEERMEREIAEMEAEMEAAAREEEERERAFNEKRKREAEEKARIEAEMTGDDALKRLEREAEAREEERLRARQNGGTVDTSAFDALKKSALGPAASASNDTKAMPPPPAPTISGTKPKPAHLRLETSTRVDAGEPTPGMKSVRTSRFLEIKEEARYPEGVQSPNPAQNAGKGHAYDAAFLLQFQNIFTEKPSVDWDQKVRDTLGPGDSGSSRVQSSRGGPSMSSRQPSARSASMATPMGQFGGNGRTLPSGTTSQQRFQAAKDSRGLGMTGGRVPSAGMGSSSISMSRTGSMPTGMSGTGTSRQASLRGPKGSSRRGDRGSKKEEAELAAKMPLTAHMEIAPLAKTATGWKPLSLMQGAGNTPDLSGHMPPEMVQRKVKAALNKMTPENFEKISDDIMAITAQSRNEADGRTLRQVLQLTFEKACDEAHWAGMYAKFCRKMMDHMSHDIHDESIRDKEGNVITGGQLFRKYLLTRCQEEFERGWKVNLPQMPENESEVAMMSDEYYAAAAAKRRGLGLIQFIGQLYKLKMLTSRIIHTCAYKLLDFEEHPDEASVENFTTLLRTVGAALSEEESFRTIIDMYFERLSNLFLPSPKLSQRAKFMIMDLQDLYKSGWKGTADKGPKTISEIRTEAATAQAKAEAEKARTGQRGGGGGRMGGRGDARHISGVGPPVDYHRTNVAADDLRRLQRGTSNRTTGSGLGPGGSLGPGGGLMSTRTGSRRGLGMSGANSSRTGTPPVNEKKEEPAQQNAFSALASLSGDGEDMEASEPAKSPPADS